MIHKNILAFSQISQQCEGAGNSNPSQQKTRICLSCIRNTMVADDLVTQGARSSAAKVLT